MPFIKKLDKLILKAFIGPFAVTFLVTLFILLLQFFWLYLDDFVGKGIDGATLLEFVMYLLATLVPLALPLGMLLSSIMTFGNLGERFELVAIKSAGIPLLRFMRPVFAVAAVLSIIAFLFANYVIPVAELKMRTLLYDIRVSKPAFDIKEGIFYDKLEGYTIKIGKKINDSTIRNVVVYETNYGLQDNMIIAEEGEMRISPDKQFLYFNLRNGWRYQEKGEHYTANTEFIRLGFKEYKKVFDLSSFKLSKTADSTFKAYYKMLSLQQLTKVIDSLHRKNNTLTIRTKKEVSSQLPFANIPDSIWSKAKVKNSKSIDSLIADSLRMYVANHVSAKLSGIRSQLEYLSTEYKEQQKQVRLHQLERHRKFSLSLACIVLFLIGAPLGSIIRKGGIGLPLVISVIFFIFYHIINKVGEQFITQAVLQPFTGMWLSTMLLLPIGAWLTWKAMQDAQILQQDFYQGIFRFFSNTKEKLPTQKNNL